MVYSFSNVLLYLVFRTYTVYWLWLKCFYILTQPFNTYSLPVCLYLLRIIKQTFLTVVPCLFTRYTIMAFNKFINWIHFFSLKSFNLKNECLLFWNDCIEHWVKYYRVIKDKKYAALHNISEYLCLQIKFCLIIKTGKFLFSLPESRRLTYCDHSLSVVRPSVRPLTFALNAHFSEASGATQMKPFRN